MLGTIKIDYISSNKMTIKLIAIDVQGYTEFYDVLYYSTLVHEIKSYHHAYIITWIWFYSTCYPIVSFQWEILCTRNPVTPSVCGQLIHKQAQRK